MIALRKPQARDTMTGGHRWDFMEKLLTSGIDLSSDAKLLLYVLVTHHGDERRVNPGLRRLAEMCSMSNGRCMAARDELIAAGLITCTLGSGTRSSEYHLVALDAWYAEWVAARSSVRNYRLAFRIPTLAFTPSKRNLLNHLNQKRRARPI